MYLRTTVNNRSSLNNSSDNIAELLAELCRHFKRLIFFIEHTIYNLKYSIFMFSGEKHTMNVLS